MIHRKNSDTIGAKDDDRILKNGHDKISTFNIGHEHSGMEWRAIFRQLIAQGYLATDTEGYGVLKLTPKAWPLLKRSEEPQTVMLRALRKASKAKTRKKKSANMIELSTQDELLFESLRALRAKLAKEQNVPPYVIFHDKTLAEMAAVKPATLDQMLNISGIGNEKLNRYGEIFLNEISCFQAARKRKSRAINPTDS